MGESVVQVHLGLGLGSASKSMRRTVHVDAVFGNDAHEGGLASPLATLAAASAAALTSGDNAVVLLKAGSVWRETLDLSSFAGVTVAAYGDVATDGLPVVDAADVLTGAWETSTDADRQGAGEARMDRRGGPPRPC